MKARDGLREVKVQMETKRQEVKSYGQDSSNTVPHTSSSQIGEIAKEILH